MSEMINNKKPWLITPEADLIEEDLKQALMHGSNLNQYIEKNPFPGATTSVENKMEWFQAMYKDYCADMIATPKDAAKYYLWYHAPQQIRLDIIIESKQLDSLHLNKEEERTFLKNFPKYLPEGMEYANEGGDSFDDCKKWMLRNVKIPLNGSRGVLLACLNCSCDDKFADKAHGILTHLGINFYSNFHPPENRQGNSWISQKNDKISECMYGGYEEGDPTDPKDGSVHCCIKVAFHASRAKAPGEAIFTEAHQKQLEKFKEMGDERTYVLARKEGVSPRTESKTDNHPLTTEYYEPLWLPSSFRTHCIRISNHINNGEGESILFKAKLKKNDTDSGNIRLKMFKQELFYCRKLKGLKMKFGAVFALTYVVSRVNNTWLYDNKHHEECRDLFASLAKLWRTNLLKNDDTSLGIGIPQEETDKVGLTHSRKLLYQIMDGFTNILKDSQYITSFDWKPALKKRENVEEFHTDQKKRKST